MRSFVAMIATVMLLGSCKKNQENERKTILIYGNYDSKEIEVINGVVKDVIMGDSITAKDFDHIYFDRNGNMVRANSKYLSHYDTLYRKVTYQSIYNKAGKKTEMKARYSVYPDSCGCNGVLIWRFDSKGRVVEYHSGKSGFANTVEFKYDTTGRIKYKNVWGKKDVPDRYTYKYDVNNRLVEIDGVEMGWNDKEEPTALSTISYKYLDFDLHNNWIRAVEDNDTITRKITYY